MSQLANTIKKQNKSKQHTLQLWIASSLVHRQCLPCAVFDGEVLHQHHSSFVAKMRYKKPAIIMTRHAMNIEVISE